jgi:hypothetical protein
MGACLCGSALVDVEVPLDAVSRAERWLAVMLQDWPQPVTALQAVARRYGMAWMTIRRAQKRLGVKVIKRNDQWFWELPMKRRIFLEGDDHLDGPFPEPGDGPFES